ncbi:MAG: hypothetical protein RL722_1837 [Pseudomonadota bacterium]|jgi:c-di-GMP-binding flagellar brake protein YcgR
MVMRLLLSGGRAAAPAEAPTQPPPLAVPLGAPMSEPYRLGDAHSIQDLLTQIAAARVPVSIASASGESYTTELLRVDPQARHLAFAAEERDLRLRSLCDAEEAMAVAFLDRVRVQFDLIGLVMVHGARATELQAQWPAAVYRFQRRESFRVQPPEHLKPVVRLDHPQAGPLNLRVVDVSLGGLAVQLPGDLPPVLPGSRFVDAEIELDALTRLRASLRVVHVTVMGGGDAPPSGARLGCEWISLGGDGARTLQRYVDQTQKRQRALAQASGQKPSLAGRY